MEWYNELKELAIMIVPWLTGGGTALLINFLKEYLNVPDRDWFLGINARTWFAVGVSFIVGLIVVFAEGGFDPSQLVVSNAAETVAIIWSTATAVYFKALNGGGPEEDNRGVF